MSSAASADAVDAGADALLAQLTARKQSGNTAFAARSYSSAVVEYTAGIDALLASALAETALPTPGTGAPEESASASPPASFALLVAQVYANRSASFLELSKPDRALSDAQAAVNWAPGWPKGHLRLGKALCAVKRFRDAVAAYSTANILEGERDPATSKMIREADAAAVKQEASMPITSIDQFARIYMHQSDVRVRLAALATFWNAAPPANRYAIFKRFLLIVAGPQSVEELEGGSGSSDASGPHISQFPPEVLTSLPMDNYKDVSVPPNWTHFYKGLDAAGRTELFTRCWELCSPTEQSLIIADIKAFFMPGAGDASSGATGEDVEGDGSALVSSSGSGSRSGSQARGAGVGVGGVGLNGITHEDLVRLLSESGRSGVPVLLPSRTAEASRSVTGAAATASAHVTVAGTTATSAVPSTSSSSATDEGVGTQAAIATEAVSDAHKA